MYSQFLIIIGLLFNLIGAYKLYKSVVAYPYHQYAVSGKDKEALSVATLNIDIAKKGFKCIFFGIILQIIAIATFINYDMIIQILKNLCSIMCK